MTDRDDTEALEALHREHLMFSSSGPSGCAAYCVACPTERYDWQYREKQHTEHRLRVLAAYVARKVSAAKAEAWEEGFNAGSISAMQKLHTKPNFTPNPYRDQP